MKARIVQDINHNREIIEKVQNSKKQTAIAQKQQLDLKKFEVEKQKYARRQMMQSLMLQEHEFIRELVGKRDLTMVQRSINSQKMQSHKISMAFGNKVNKLIRLTETENYHSTNNNSFNSARQRVQSLKTENKKRD